MKRNRAAAIFGVLALAMAGQGTAQTTAAPASGDAHGAKHGGAMAQGATAAGAGCASPVRLSPEAEKRLGGAAYTPHGSAAGHDATTHAPAASGAHEMHGTQLGGHAFFMAPNKLHHIEALYTDECGFRVVVFNAFTEPVAVARFRGFMRVLPEDQNHPEQLRFLAPDPDGSLLEAHFADPPPRPFEVELYMEFPDSPDPVLFNITVRAAAH